MALCSIKGQSDAFYDSDPEEDLDMTPEWMKERETHDDELEQLFNKLPFKVNKITRGQSRGTAGGFFAKKAKNNIA